MEGIDGAELSWFIMFQKYQVAFQQIAGLAGNQNALCGQFFCGHSDVLFRYTIESLCHGGIKPHGPAGEALQQDFQCLRFGISLRIDLRKHFPKSIPAPVPLAIILIFVDQKGFLKPVKDGSELFHQETGLFLQLLNIEGTGSLNKGENLCLFQGGLCQRFAVKRGEQIHILVHNPSQVTSGEPSLYELSI